MNLYTFIIMIGDYNYNIFKLTTRHCGRLHTIDAICNFYYLENTRICRNYVYY